MPVTENFTHASHPLNIVRSICQPGDFIVFKLDIDVAGLEASIMTEIERDSKLISCIAEIAYEQHYDHPGAPFHCLCQPCRPHTSDTTSHSYIIDGACMRNHHWQMAAEPA